MLLNVMMDGGSRTSADIVKQVRVDNLKSESALQGTIDHYRPVRKPANQESQQGQLLICCRHYSQRTHPNVRRGTPTPFISSRDPQNSNCERLSEDKVAASWGVI